MRAILGQSVGNKAELLPSVAAEQPGEEPQSPRPFEGPVGAQSAADAGFALTAALIKIPPLMIRILSRRTPGPGALESNSSGLAPALSCLWTRGCRRRGPPPATCLSKGGDLRPPNQQPPSRRIALWPPVPTSNAAAASPAPPAKNYTPN